MYNEEYQGETLSLTISQYPSTHDIQRRKNNIEKAFCHHQDWNHGPLDPS